MVVTMQGNPLKLYGKMLKVGDKMPDFEVVDNGLAEVKGADLHGVRVFACVPSLDTGVCDMEIRNFNKKAAELSGVKIYAVSMDLPFAQARWCGAAGVAAVKTLSDYQKRSFGKATGTLIEGLELLVRAVFVVDADNIIRYVEYVPEVTNHPDYDALYAALKEVVK